MCHTGTDLDDMPSVWHNAFMFSAKNARVECMCSVSIGVLNVFMFCPFTANS